MKNKRKIINVIIVIAFIILALIFSVILYKNNAVVQLKKQLDLGNKYLEELNYDEAIIAFEKVIEIAPMNVEAYLGLASAYSGKGDYETAAEILQKGYEVSGDERLRQEVDRVIIAIEELQKTQEEVAKEAEEFDSSNNRWMNPKISIDDRTKNAIENIVVLCNEGRYREACDAIVTEEFRELINTYDSVLNGQNWKGVVNTFFDGNNIFVEVIEWHEEDYNITCSRLVCIPEEGVGFIIYRQYGDYYDDFKETILNNDGWGYLTCYAEECRFNGKFRSYYDSDGEGNPWNAITECEGVLVDDYYDGEVLRTHTWKSGDGYKEIYKYANGQIIPYGEDESGENIIIAQQFDNERLKSVTTSKENFEEVYRERRFGPVYPDIEDEVFYGDNEPWLPWQ